MDLFLFRAFVLVCIFLSGCTRQQDHLPPKTLRLAINEDPCTLDPRKGGDVLSAYLHFMLYEGLTKLETDGSVRPAQCSSIEVSKDQTVYTFTLGNTRWSDGSFVTSYDFERAWKQMLSPTFPSPNAYLLYCIRGAEKAKKNEIPLEEVGIEAPDATTLIVELEAPIPYFLSLISFCVFSPIHSDMGKTERMDPVISNGPFVLAEWKHHNELVLKKNPLFRSPQEVKLDAISLHVIESEMTALRLYEHGELDLIGPPFSNIPLDALGSLQKKGTLKKSPSAATTFIAFNTSSFPFSNQNLRKAFSLAIHRNAIVKDVTQLDEHPALSFVPPMLTRGKSKAFYEDREQEKAQGYFAKALEELGISKEQLQDLLTYRYSYTDLGHKVAQILQQQWLGVLGIQVHLESSDHKILLESLSKKNYQFIQTICRAQYFDPMNILERFKSKENVKNYSLWENAQYQRLLERSFQESGEKRSQTLLEAEQILLEEMPVAPLFHWSLCYLVKPYIKNLELSPVGGIFFERLDMDPSL